MMLLTAFVLVIGFVALTGMVARVTQLPEATQSAADRPIYIEASAVARGVEQLMRDTNNLVAVREDGQNMPVYTQAVSDALQHMIILESARGYRLQLDPLDPPACDDLGPDLLPGTGDDVAVMSATFSLADTETIISFTIRYDVYDAWTQGTAPGTDPVDWSDGILQPDPAEPDPDNRVTSCTGP